jgi:pyruvate,water dikinase
MNDTDTAMFLSLTSDLVEEEQPLPSKLRPTDAKVVGGKAASLARLYSIPHLAPHVPKSFVLTVDFFQPWIDQLLSKENDNGVALFWDEAECVRLQKHSSTLPMNAEQKHALELLGKKMTSFNDGLAAVRSSAPEEDGTEQSWAGAFTTKLGVTASNLEQAVRECFASRWDPRVMSYSSVRRNKNEEPVLNLSFAVIVMEMVDSEIAGVAFTANPLNSDRDELVVDSSFGLGESVVDGSVTADRYVYDKVKQTVITSIIGSKRQQKRLLADGKGTETVNIDDINQQTQSSLSEEQLHELAKIICCIENEYGMPMDVEWAFAASAAGTMQLKLLQARPITTLCYIDEKMMTKPGEKRILYYDYNVVSDATTTTPFTAMDMDYYSWASSAMMGFPDRNIFTDDPTMPLFKGATRQWCNLSIFLKYISTSYLANASQMADPYLASIFASKDCDQNKYRMNKLPKDVSLVNLFKLMWQIPWRKLHKVGAASKKDPEKASLEYQEIAKRDMEKFQELKTRGPNMEAGLQAYAHELYIATKESFGHEVGILFFAVLPLFKELDKERREGKTEQRRSEYDALCSGYTGDPLMQMNIHIYDLANKLPKKVWEEYTHEDLPKLATRIQQNLQGEVLHDLPNNFLEGWSAFMDSYGWDGHNQLFPSCPRYSDSPVTLLSMLRQNVGSGVTNPSTIQEEQVRKRREVMELHEERARATKICMKSALSKVKKRNACLEHLMWIRNAPKLRLTQMCGIVRAAVLKVEETFVAKERLESKGDIFHMTLSEVDQALRDESLDLMALVRPRKAVHERALRATECPLLVDSRCRILRRDPPDQGEHQEGTLVGSAVSPGIATGRVRIVHNPSEQFEPGEILAAVVTSPAWTPLFAGASAVILQIGGALQHGALCAREFGKPAVSNIDINSVLKTGMLVSVDGNTGTIKIIEES